MPNGSIPIEKLHYEILVKCFPQYPFSKYFIFSDKMFGIHFLFSVTYVIYLGTKWQYHHHIIQDSRRHQLSSFGLLISGPVEWLSERRILNIWMRRRWVKQYLYFSNLKLFCLRFLTGRDLICHSKTINLDRPPIHAFCPYISPQLFEIHLRGRVR